MGSHLKYCFPIMPFVSLFFIFLFVTVSRGSQKLAEHLLQFHTAAEERFAILSPPTSPLFPACRARPNSGVAYLS